MARAADYHRMNVAEKAAYATGAIDIAIELARRLLATRARVPCLQTEAQAK